MIILCTICNMNTYVVIFCILISEVFAISIDYYIYEDLNNGTSDHVSNEPDARRTIMESPLLHQLTNTTISSNECDNNTDEEEKIILSYKIGFSKRPIIYTLISPKDTTKSQLFNNGYVPTHESIRKTPIPKIELSLNLFTENDYVDETDKDLEIQMLRNEYDLNQSISIESKLQIPDTKKIPYTTFYNLEPAADQKIRKDKKKHNFYKRWYVPQDFPCWELPLVYGELGMKRDKTNIFLLYGSNLINVFDPWNETLSTYKMSEAPMSHFVNKWCGVQPCYGDHTLCLFPDKVISSVCERGYKVSTPTILYQNTIISTINSMRNRVASGSTDTYSHLPTAANMMQVIYDYDLEKISEAWLRQCLPGSAPCSGLDGKSVSQLECTKFSKYCCIKSFKTAIKCTPRPECFVDPVIGCLHIWFSYAGKNLTSTDVRCGHTSVLNFNTVQMFWAETSKIGCAYGEKPNGDVRIVCNFSPGAPFLIDAKLFCGIIAHNDIHSLRDNKNVSNLDFLATLGIKWRQVIKTPRNISYDFSKLVNQVVASTEGQPVWGLDSLTKIYPEGWVRKNIGHPSNGTQGMIARLVARYQFIDKSESKCDSEESIYEVGQPGSLCVERGRTFKSLCYDFRDPTPGYRLIAVAAPIALFSLILYDWFSGVVRQNNN